MSKVFDASYSDPGNFAVFQKYYNNTFKIDDNYKELEGSLNLYNSKNSPSYDTIDNSGNLLFDDVGFNPTKRDGLFRDSKDLLLQQNNMYLLGTFIVAFATIIIIVVK
jgi:hypothetical protein